MKLTRRDLALLAPALAAAQTPKPTLSSKVYKYGELPVKPNGGNEGRAVLDGRTHTGYPVELHITDLGPGLAPHAPHHHVHEEILMLRFGQLDVTINGATTRASAGSVIYVNSNEEHGWKNPGPDRAQYFVIALGREA
ncbi:MAG TPA: cupin domain-containing protein [Verrucomicrobiae bacterium]|nr:cupin domain-containing protein [Verrucomicrobiae bacterium]